jgi:hypothetical protein
MVRDIRLNEAFRIADRSINVALRREIENGARPVLCQEARNVLLVANISLEKKYAGRGRRRKDYADFPFM